jgi:hypothetical protein
MVSDQTARRVARRIGLLAKRSRRFRGTNDNLGGFQLLDPRNNAVVAGPRCELTAREVVDLCGAGARKSR